MAYCLVAKNLAKIYNKRKVVQDVSLEINAGEIVGLLGPNGAGKTTTFYMLVGIVQPNFGNIIVNDTDITNYPIHKRSEMGIGYLPQEASVFRGLSVEDNIKSVLQMRKDIDDSARKDVYDYLIDEFRIGHITQILGMSLSGGERRRVEIARALAANPKFILLDEPFAGVDPISVKDIKRNIEQLKKIGIGVLITDHNVRETLDVCERAYVVNNGKILAYGTPDQVLDNQQVQEVYIPKNYLY